MRRGCEITTGLKYIIKSERSVTYQLGASKEWPKKNPTRIGNSKTKRGTPDTGKVREARI